MSGKPYAYSVSEIETLLRLRAEGFSYKEIARQFPPRSPEAIRTFLYRYFRAQRTERAA